MDDLILNLTMPEKLEIRFENKLIENLDTNF